MNSGGAQAHYCSSSDPVAPPRNVNQLVSIEYRRLPVPSGAKRMSSSRTPLAQFALEQMLTHLDGIERQMAILDGRLEQIASSDRWNREVRILTGFRRISTLAALGLIGTPAVRRRRVDETSMGWLAAVRLPVLGRR